jgi:hypothetical protein
MKLSADQAQRRIRQLGEIRRILELRIDAKRVELDANIEAKNTYDLAVQIQQRVFDKASLAVNACSESMAAARAVNFSPGAMPGFMAALKQLQKRAQTERKNLRAACERLADAELLVAQTQDELQKMRARDQQLETMSDALLKDLAVHRSLLEDTQQDEDYASYLGAKAHTTKPGAALAI